MQKAPPTPKGFRDIAPALTKKRRRVINQIVEVLEDKGFEPMETPTVEFADTLTGKYGDEERLIYKFKDRGGRNLALRYDLRSEEHTSELQSQSNLVCRLLLEKK